MKLRSYEYDGIRDCDVQHVNGEKYRIRIWSDYGPLFIVTADAAHDRNEYLQRELAELCGLQTWSCRSAHEGPGCVGEAFRS